MPGPLLVDVTHTSHTRARTGVQRVTRSLLSTLGTDARPITHDPYARAWRLLRDWEHENLASEVPHRGSRGSRWPLQAMLRGHTRRFVGCNLTDMAAVGAEAPSGMIVPEIFSAATSAAFPLLSALTEGPKVAVFHDAIALQHPELAPPATVERFPGYLQELLTFDGIAAVSEASREALLDYWKWAGFTETPPVAAIPLGLTPPATLPGPAQAPGRPVILCVGSIEARKNHLALLEACEQLWASGADFELRVIGHLQRQTGAAAAERMRALQRAGRPARYDGAVPEPELEAAYAACTFTVYPSRIEGFGLPVLESLARGKPCVCSRHGALGEISRGGGCLALEAVDAASLAAGLQRLLTSPAELASLAQAARGRPLRTWSDYARDLRAWMGTLERG